MTAGALPITDEPMLFSAEKEQKGSRVALWLLAGQLIGATFLEKIAVPFGNTQLFFAMFLMIGLTGLGFFSGALRISPKAFLFYLVLIGTMILTQILGGQDFSPSSLSLFIVIHVFYVFTIRTEALSGGEQFLIFRNIISVCAGLGIAQFFLQFLIGADWAFFIDTKLPPSLIQQGFHEMNALGYKSDTYKSTGFFFLEPAIFCQFLAIGLIVEILYFKDFKRIVLQLAAIALTFSGTGLIILLALLPVYLVQQRKFVLLLAGFAVVMTAPIWAPPIGLGKTVGRIAEFSSKHSSGYARFVSIFPTLDRFVFSEPDKIMFGNGAGSILRTFQTKPIDYEAHNPSWGKMIFEYGLPASLLYYAFIAYLLWRGQGSAYIKVALFMTLMILGEYVLPPTVHGLILALVVWPPQGREGPEPQPQEVT